MKPILKVLRCSNTASLESLLEENREEFADFFAGVDYNEVVNNRKIIEELATKRRLVSELDFTKTHNVSFVDQVLSLATLLGDRFLFRSFCRIAKQKELNQSSVILASAQYLENVTSFDEIKEALPNMLPYLKTAYLEESDDGKDVEFVLIRYYVQCIQEFGDFHPDLVAVIRDDVKTSLTSKEYKLLKTSTLESILNLPISTPKDTIPRIFSYFESPSNATVSFSTTYVEERNTNYSTRWINGSRTIRSAMSISWEMYNSLSNRDELFYSLHRGVEILKTEHQLICYLAAYGKMHHKKLEYALNFLPEIHQRHSLIDWGCGQGIAALSYLENIDRNQNNGSVSEVILIEPSLKALQRAALHVKRLGLTIQTLNTDFDAIPDYIRVSNNTFLHLFSNIIDVEHFSLTKLLNKLEHSFKGENYFLIVSPYINEAKTSRIDAFVSHFENSDGFNLMNSTSLTKGSWYNGWSIVTRLFKVNIK